MVVSSNVYKSLRIAGYAAILLIGALSLAPPALRPGSGAPGQFEHLGAYLSAGLLLALSRDIPRQRLQALWLVPYAGALEIAQLFVLGRHSRFSDFAVSALGAALGIIIAFGIAPVLPWVIAKQQPVDQDAADIEFIQISGGYAWMPFFSKLMRRVRSVFASAD